MTESGKDYWLVTAVKSFIAYVAGGFRWRAHRWMVLFENDSFQGILWQDVFNYIFYIKNVIPLKKLVFCIFQKILLKLIFVQWFGICKRFGAK